jgi:hypothetical protein
MRITLFTGNQPRHVAFIEALTAVASEVYAVQECTTVFPGEVEDFFARSDVMQRYFARVLAAEREVFGHVRFTPDGARSMVLKAGDVNLVPLESFGPALDADAFLVFGASFIKGPLCELLEQRFAVNVHMGVSPFYRGSSTNFWPLYDGRPDLVGATIHRLTSGLDSGPIVFHAFPEAGAHDPFVLGMRAVRSAQLAVVDALRSGELFDAEPVPQDRSLELRYTRNRDFTDDVAEEYLARAPSADDVRAGMEQRPAVGLVRARAV